MAGQNFVEPPKIKVVDTLPAVGEAEVGEMFYLTASDRVYVRLITGWKYLATDG